MQFFSPCGLKQKNIDLQTLPLVNDSKYLLHFYEKGVMHVVNSSLEKKTKVKIFTMRHARGISCNTNDVSSMLHKAIPIKKERV